MTPFLFGCNVGVLFGGCLGLMLAATLCAAGRNRDIAEARREERARVFDELIVAARVGQGTCLTPCPVDDDDWTLPLGNWLERYAAKEADDAD